MSHATSDQTARLSPEIGGYELLVTGDGGVSTIPLPREGELLIGRAEDADLRLTGNSVSRRHASLRVSPSEFVLEDLGSSNGTIVRGDRTLPHQAVQLTPGESFLIGEFVVVLRPRRSIATTRHVWSPEYFEARVAEQCERCRQTGGAPFFVLRIEVNAGNRFDEGEVIASELKPFDVLGRLSKHEWSVLLLDASESNANAVAGRVVLALSELGCEANARVLGYPRDGTSAGSLMASAPEAPEAHEPGAPAVLRSPAMLALYRQTEPIARAPINVLILGETGVGKDVLALSIHKRSERGGRPFLRLNCAALAEPLLESELFGHEKGAFTGAVQNKQGLLESASGGTVFLDEIGEFPQRLQAKLLQVLETREILSVGSVRARPIDVRFVAATNRDLEAEALAGHFRSDLYYRLAGFTAVIPPLRERREDILPLAQEFVRRSAEKMDLKIPVRIRDDATMRLLDYPWPGNVRELRNVIERAVVLSEGRAIGPEHLPLEKMGSVMVVGRPARAPEVAGVEMPIVGLSPEELGERQRILDALTQCAGNQSKAAAKLGISRSTLINRLDAYRIGRPRKRPM